MIYNLKCASGFKSWFVRLNLSTNKNIYNSLSKQILAGIISKTKVNAIQLYIYAYNKNDDSFLHQEEKEKQQ